MIRLYSFISWLWKLAILTNNFFFITKYYNNLQMYLIVASFMIIIYYSFQVTFLQDFYQYTLFISVIPVKTYANADIQKSTLSPRTATNLVSIAGLMC
jgi:hypothetical protein